MNRQILIQTITRIIRQILTPKLFKKIFLIILYLGIQGLSTSVFAANACTNEFPTGVAGLANNSKIDFHDCGTQVLNSGSVLPFGTISAPGGSCSSKTCGGVQCTVSGTGVGVLSAGAFQSSSNAGGNITVGVSQTVTIDGNNNTTTDYNTVAVNSSGTLNFTPSTSGTTTYRIKNFNLQGNSTVNFQPGDYWIESMTVGGGTNSTAIFNVVGGGTARFFIKNSINPGRTLSWNASGSANQFFIYSYANITISQGASVINAIMYVSGNATIQDQTAFTGAITANNITLSNTATITYDPNAVTSTDYGFICPGSNVTQFLVTAPSTGTNCQNMTITVSAQNSFGQVITNYTGAITITTQNTSGTWVSSNGHGTFVGGSGGTATYQFTPADLGVVSFQLNYPASGSSPVTIKAFQTNSPSIFGLSNPITFQPTSILVTATAVPNPPASPPAAFSTTQVAGVNSANVFLTAYTSSSCGTVTSYTGTKTIRFWTSFINPTTGTLNSKVNGIVVANSSGATPTTQNITFTNGVATIVLNYPDVGQLSLNVQDTSSGGPTGASGNYVTIPFAFAMNIPSNNATQNLTSASCVADTVFQKAGQGFVVNVQPQNAQGAATPNYNNETTPQGILLQSIGLIAPVGGRNGSANNGAIGNGSSFTKVIGSGAPFTGAYFTGSAFSFDEVGCINLQAGVGSGSYLGAGNVTVTQVVGRFTPDHFSASGNAPQFNTACSSGNYTYLDQPFIYGTAPILTVTAQAAANSTTQNYTGSFWKLANSFNPVYNRAYFSVDTNVTTPSLTLLTTNATKNAVDNGNGTTTVTFGSGAGFQIQRLTNNLVSPFNSEIQLSLPTITDTDNVTCTGSGCVTGGFAFGTIASGGGIAFSSGKLFYHGRLYLVDAIGSEISNNPPLNMAMQTQYYNTSNGNPVGFVINTNDNCTSVSASNLALSPSTGITTTPTITTPVFSQGVINITFSPPNATGYVDVTAQLSAAFANLPWLQFNWTYDSTGGAYSGDPIARASFGAFPGNNRIIYQKENFQ